MSLSVEQINKLESENERLAKEVAQWKHEYEMLDACCELYSAKLKELKAENDKLKQEIKELAHYLACMTEQRNKANTILQEIKAIVCGNYEIIDPQGRKDIIKLITKAEE